MRVTTSPSDLNKRIEIQSYTDVSDNMGGQTRTWATTSTRWAGIWPISASEQVKAGQLSMDVTHRIRTRYCSGGIKSHDRVKYGTRYFSIVSVICPNEDHEWFDLLAKENIS